MAPRTPRGAEDHGAVLVEFALVLPVLMMLLLGMFSGATAWNQNQALAQGARVAARYAATLPLPSTDAGIPAWLEVVGERAMAASEGEMDAAVPGRNVCVAYVHPDDHPADSVDTNRTRSWRRLPNGTESTSTTACFAEGVATDPVRIQVVMGRDGFLDTGFYRQSLQLTRSAVYRYELQGGL